jgi:glycosyltransferase involved in cell wall biosynthesis
VTIGPQQTLMNDMLFEIPEEFVHFTRRWDFDRFVAFTFEQREHDQSQNSKRLSYLKRISEFTRDVGQRTIIPDGKIGWYPFAVKKGRELIEKINPSIILAMGGPYTGLMVAAKLSKEFGIPWVADILDPWANNYSIKKYFPLSVLNRQLERKTLSTCSKILIVTKPWADELRDQYGASCVGIVSNAYDDEDFMKTLKPEYGNENKINVVYTGYLYRRQVPEVFFAAVRQFLNDIPDARIEVNFYGPMYPSFFFDYVKKYQLEESVCYHGQVSYQEAVDLQREADVLLLFTWGTKGVLLAKTLSYIGAGRPILAAGPKNDTTAEFVEENKLGMASNEAELIKEFLQEMYCEKKQSGRIASPRIDDSLKTFFTYRNQTKKLLSVLEEVIGL